MIAPKIEAMEKEYDGAVLFYKVSILVAGVIYGEGGVGCCTPSKQIQGSSLRHMYGPTVWRTKLAAMLSDIPPPPKYFGWVHAWLLHFRLIHNNALLV